jgi:hypothetical protein
MNQELFNGLVEEMMRTLRMARVKWIEVDINANTLRSD